MKGGGAEEGQFVNQEVNTRNVSYLLVLWTIGMALREAHSEQDPPLEPLTEQDVHIYIANSIRGVAVFGVFHVFFQSGLVVCYVFFECFPWFFVLMNWFGFSSKSFKRLFPARRLRPLSQQRRHGRALRGICTVQNG